MNHCQITGSKHSNTMSVFSCSFWKLCLHPFWCLTTITWPRSHLKSGSISQEWHILPSSWPTKNSPTELFKDTSTPINNIFLNVLMKGDRVVLVGVEVSQINLLQYFYILNIWFSFFILY